MERLSRFEHFRYIGDKRTQVVHDIDTTDETDVIADLVAAEAFLAFGPDTLAEARNRGYRPCRHCATARGSVNGSFLSGGRRLARYLVGPVSSSATGAGARPPGLVIVHGFPTEPLDANQSAMTFPQLADRVASDLGWGAVTFTLSGCGTSEGDFALNAWLEDLGNAVTHLQESVSASPIFIAGTGLGGPLGLAVGANNPDIAGVAALAPQVDLSDWGAHARRLVEHARDVGAIRTPGFPTDLESWANEFRRFDPLDAARRFAPRPLLIICGSEDERFPLSEARSLADAHGSAEFRVLTGGGNRPRHDPRAVAILMGWLSRSVNRPTS